MVGVKAGLLAVLQVYGKVQSVFDHLDRARGSIAGQQSGRGSKPLLAAQRHLGALNYAAAACQFEQQARQQLLALIDGQRSRLQDQVVGKAVHDQPRQAIVLGVDQAQRVCVVHLGQFGTRRNGYSQAVAPEGFVDSFLRPREQAHLDLAAPVQIAARQPAAIGRRHVDDVAIIGSRRDLLNGAAKDPRVTLAHRLVAVWFQSYCCVCTAYQCGYLRSISQPKSLMCTSSSGICTRRSTGK